MKSMIRVGNGQGFWGDSIDAPVNLANGGHLDYLTLDYLAEVTLSIMQRQKLKNPDAGYAGDFVDLIKRILPQIQNNGLKVITNAGGVNPEACRKRLLNLSEGSGNNIRIGVIKGDNIYSDIKELRNKGVSFNNTDSGKSFNEIAERYILQMYT